jgi:sterol 3beta-glucosyltransferase
VTRGSEGDVRPVLGLAEELRGRGHDVELAGPGYARPRAEAQQLRFRSLAPCTREHVAELTRQLAEEPTKLRHLEIMARHLDAFSDTIVPLSLAAARDADLVVTHNLSLFGLLAAEVANRPCVVVHPFPAFLQSDRFLWSGNTLGFLGNRYLWWWARPFLRRVGDAAFASAYERFGLRPRRDVLLKAGHSPLLNLLPFSPIVVPPERRWGQRYVVTGYWTADQEGKLPEDLQRFIDAGAPPVVITFGSMTGFDSEAITLAIVDAVAKAGVRAVLQAGWANLGTTQLPDSVFLLHGSVPHLTLFRQAACVVHHGGAGTAGTALRAGVPQIILPTLGDQPFWARRLRSTGVIRHWRPMRDLTSRWLARALTETVRDQRLADRARSVAASMAGENGASVAADAIERLFVA